MEMDASGKLNASEHFKCRVKWPCSNSRITKQTSSYNLFFFIDLLVLCFEHCYADLCVMVHLVIVGLFILQYEDNLVLFF
jgi:hypothetical protein